MGYFIGLVIRWETLPVYLFGDPSLIERTTQNLITHTQKFAQHGIKNE